MPQEQGKPRIVVGVDGSPSAQEALRWAVEQARLTGAVVDAVAAWEWPAYYGWDAPGVNTDLSGATADTLDQSVKAVTGDGEPAVEIRRQVVEGTPARVLLEAARGAALLVVGSRGHGGFTGALLGSISQHCAQHAPCPVVIVRDRAQ